MQYKNHLVLERNMAHNVVILSLAERELDGRKNIFILSYFDGH